MNNKKPIRIALDGMGGDSAPNSVVAGAMLSLKRNPHLTVQIFGPIADITALIDPEFVKRVEVIDCDRVISNDEKVSQAVRRGNDSTMGRAIQSVKQQNADAIVSSGNTGALMALATVTLRTLKGIDRPAICSAFPTQKGFSCMLDLGANVECSSEHLVQFAMLGEVFARTVLSIQEPKIGLLNIGIEAMKGNDTIRQTSSLLESSSLKKNYIGFIEGDHIGKGVADVVVTDGFTGNIALKSMEGTASLIFGMLKNTFSSSLLSKLGYLLAKPALKKFREKLDPRTYNGAVLLGLNGIVVKSHGSTDALGFYNAIQVAVDMIDQGFYDRISEEMDLMRALDSVGNIEVSSNFVMNPDQGQGA